MSAPWFILSGTCVAFSERRLFWDHTRRSFASMQSHFEMRPPWWIMYDTTDLLSERTSTWCPRMSGRKNWQAWHTATISRQLMCRPDSSSDQRLKVGCPRTTLLNPCWKCLSWQPSFCAPCLESRLALARRGPSNRPGLIHRPESPLRRWNLLLQPELDGSHVKQTQLKYRRSRCHMSPHFLESFEQTGGTFLEGGRVVLNCCGLAPLRQLLSSALSR